jgi:hypothetical protein
VKKESHKSVQKQVVTDEHDALDYLEDFYGLEKGELLPLIEKRKDQLQNSFPTFILRDSKLSSLEAIVKFLRENRKLSYQEIAQLLCRKPATLAVTYSVAKSKKAEAFQSELDIEEEFVPFSAFTAKLSVLESICLHLKSQDKSYSEIARVLGKDPRTVWTVCKRAQGKVSEKGADRE